MAEKLQNYQSLDHLLKTHKRKENGPFTHTRIGDSTKGIYAGSYNISEYLMPQFWKLYHKKVFIDKQLEYLTETQNKETGGALLVDIDMRFDLKTKKRVYELSEISDIVELYAESLIELLCLPDNIQIPVYVFEKKNIVTIANKHVKDGLHLVIGLNLKHTYQMLLREIVIEKEKTVNNIFGEEGLKCINSVENIFDKSISIGRNNWQVWGSRKPGYDAYELKYMWNIIIDNKDFQVELSDEDINIKNLLPIVSAKNKSFIKCEQINAKYKLRFNKIKEKNIVKKKKLKKAIIF